MKRFKKLLSFLLIAVMLISAFTVPASAMLSYRKGFNRVHSAYSKGRYYKNFTRLTKTEDDRTNLLAVALSQLGYTEGDATHNSSGFLIVDYSGENGGTSNYTEFAYNIGNWGVGHDYPWDATFVSWALYQSRCTDHDTYNYAGRFDHKETGEYYWKEFTAAYWAKYIQDNTSFYYFAEQNGKTYVPNYGDLIFFKRDSEGINNMGIVIYVSDETVYCVEGNYNDEVAITSCSIFDTSIDGYASLPFKNTDNIPDVDYSGANPTVGLYMTRAELNLFADEECTENLTDANDADVVIPIHRMLEVSAVSENGISLKASYEDFEGFIKRDIGTFIQISPDCECPHSWDEGKVTKRANCKETGIYTYTCLFCGCFRDEVIPFTHAWDNPIVTTKPKCGVPGEATRVCVYQCGATMTEPVEPLEHSWDDGIVTTEPKCGEFGEMTYTCIHKCGETYTMPIDPLEHDWGDPIEVVDANCTSEGHELYKCGHCHEPKEVTLEPNDKHSWDEGVVTTKPTHDSDGVLTLSCTLCEATDTKPIEKIEEHIPGKAVVLDDGTTIISCTVCGEVLETVSAKINIGDIDNNGVIEADDYIALKRIFFGMVKMESLESPENAYERCDVDKNGEFTADDYIKLKRVYFGMATIG